MNLNSAIGTAILRGAYLAFGSGFLTFLTTWTATDELKAPIIAGGVAALTALGFRGGIEGTFDQKRNATGNVSSSDVGQPGPLGPGFGH